MSKHQGSDSQAHVSKKLDTAQKLVDMTDSYSEIEDEEVDSVLDRKSYFDNQGSPLVSKHGKTKSPGRTP